MWKAVDSRTDKLQNDLVLFIRASLEINALQKNLN